MRGGKVMTKEGIICTPLCNFPVANMREDLLQWWILSGKRDFPWRETNDPYKVIIAEILLHRTRAEQIVPLYHLLLNQYPDIHTLAESSPDELTRLLRSSGLHWRWKFLHSMAVNIEMKFNGQIPLGFEELTSLPGVSHYIASAVRCFAFGYADVLLDTNTVRVTGRLLNLPITDSSRRSRLFRQVLEYFIDLKHPREFNFALIDLAALICRPRSPIHQDCPISGYCTYYQGVDGRRSEF
jgi:A/G-specific adenine glycosylase